MEILDSSQSVLWMIGACGLIICLLLFSKQFKFLLKIAIRGLVGLCAVFVTNLTIGGIIGCTVGINVMNAAVIGILGAPGFLLLYVASLLL